MAEQVEILRELNSAFEQKDLTALSNVLHPDIVHVTLPQSVNVPKQNKTQTLEYYEKMFNSWATVGTVTSTVIANTPGKIVAHMTSDITLKSGPIVAYESYISLGIDDDSSGNKKIKLAEEFIDAKAQAQGFDPFAAVDA